MSHPFNSSCARATVSSGRRVARVAVALAALAGAFALLVPTPVAAQAVNAGVDLFVTPAPTRSYVDLIDTPIPAGFFGPGSDPFTGTIYFVGEPLAPSSPLGPVDTIVERRALTSAGFLCGGPPETVPIEIVALNLVSVQPITVTYNGGMNPEPWNVRLSVSSVAPQQQGPMTLRHEGLRGGTFESTLPVIPRFIFTRTAPAAQRIIDPGPPQTFHSNGKWVYPGGPLIAQLAPCASPGGVLVDHDQNAGTALRPINPSSNFLPGVIGLPTSCAGPPTAYGKMLTEEEAARARHGVYPAQCAPVIEGAACLSNLCVVTTPGMAAIMGANYMGNGTLCIDDADHNGYDDACPVSNAAPGMGPWALALVTVLLLAGGIRFVMAGRGVA